MVRVNHEQASSPSIAMVTMDRILRYCTLAVGLVGICFILAPAAAMAQGSPPDAACKLCHVGLEEQITLPSGEILDLNVQLAPLNDSVHGVHAEEPVYCTDCHSDRFRYRFPHLPNPAETRAEFVAEITDNCERCHMPIEVHNPGHLQAIDNPNIPECADCHGGHDVEPVDTMAADPVEFCLGCHESIGDPYLQDIHDDLIVGMAAGQTCESCHGPTPQTQNEECVTCHSMLTTNAELASGETIDVHVNPQTIANSVHGDITIQGVEYGTLECIDCHLEQAESGFPHPPIEAETRREYTLNMEAVCLNCHTYIYDENRDDVHRMANLEGHETAATCFDCHGSHDIQDPDEPRERISITCGECHTEVFEEYAESVHGEALLGENNPDVPVCTDCHGVHNIENPQTAQFRVDSPELCAQCHANDEMMERHGISTDVFETYVADFHGTTVTLFQQQSPELPTNKAVCYDCHGVHDIKAVNDENSRVIRENLLETCRECHPNANANFPASWTSHYKPSLENNVAVFLINQFYNILIPLMIGGFLLFIGTDVFRRFREGREDETEE